MYMAAQILLPVRNLFISMTKGPETGKYSVSVSGPCGNAVDKFGVIVT